VRSDAQTELRDRREGRVRAPHRESPRRAEWAPPLPDHEDLFVSRLRVAAVDWFPQNHHEGPNRGPCGLRYSQDTGTHRQDLRSEWG